MTRLDEIKTREYTKEQIIAISNRIAEESGKSGVSYKSICEYNESVSSKKHTRLGRALSFIFYYKHYLGFLCIVLLPALILFPLCFTLGATGIVITILGALLGFVIASFAFPSPFSYCTACDSFGCCRQIYSYTLKSCEHTETLTNDSASPIDVRVTENLEFVILECQKCKCRKIEIVKETEEKIL